MDDSYEENLDDKVNKGWYKFNELDRKVVKE